MSPPNLHPEDAATPDCVTSAEQAAPAERSVIPRTALALEHPVGDLVLLGRQQLEDTVSASRESPRRRIIQPFHRTLDDALHRMFNAIQPGSYARPHRHLDPPKAEAWI